MISPEDIIKAHNRIKPYLHRTPIATSQTINKLLGGHNFFFKLECKQKIGSFKARGAFNKILSLKEQGKMPKKIVAVSSGNHAQGTSLACKLFGIEGTIFMNRSVSPLKIQAAKSYGTKVILVDSNQEADEKARLAEKKGAYFIHPFDDDQIIEGQGTACYEALTDLEQDNININSIFVPCGGGGLLSGTYLAAKLFSDNVATYAGEPINCNDAAISLKKDDLHIFDTLPPTIADGIRTLSISKRTFFYLKKTGGIIEVSEEEIIYWTQWLQHLLKITCEPSSAVAMAACYKWLGKQSKKQNILIIISGGNIAAETYRKIWEKNYLDVIPNIAANNTKSPL